MDATLYREKYVAFIDMLGFSNLVRAAAGDAAKQNKVVSVIERLKDTGCSDPRRGVQISYFSDCLVISGDRTPDGLSSVLFNIMIIAENLLVVDVLIRGGLTIGEIHHDEQFMFGPGMLEAYDMERFEAKHPSVLVSPEVRADIETAKLDHCLFEDVDGRRFIHYLLHYANYDPTPRAGIAISDDLALLVRHFIARRLNVDEGSPLAKAEWLEAYWNKTVGTNGVLGSVDREGDLPAPIRPAPFRSIMRIAG